jgi:hypothetical protein
VRVEHVKPSRCKEEFLKRSKENDEIKHEAKQRGGKHNFLPAVIFTTDGIRCNIA